VDNGGSSLTVDLALRTHHLGKQYRLGTQASYGTLREAISHGFRSLMRIPTPHQQDDELFWALRDVSLEVRRGEVLGIIGRNGAGKSTLLKILAQITVPSCGYAEVFGRVGSLLEVGTGFHPELTGRENIMLYGAILGMSRAEVVDRFDEIVAFSEIDRFLDTPVKHYSSGMYVRLAFSVAAHLESEILLVDEVLAVGDIAFQKKCLAKAGDVASGGRTVLFVSHNMAAVQRICTAAILLDKGRVVCSGSVSEAIDKYLIAADCTQLKWQKRSAPTTDAWIDAIEVYDARDQNTAVVTSASEPVTEITFTLGRAVRDLQISLDVLGPNDEVVFVSLPQDAGEVAPANPGQYRARVTLPPEIFLEKTYCLRPVLWVPGAGRLDVVEELRFQVQGAPSFTNATPLTRMGLIGVRGKWEIEAVLGQG